MALSQADIAKLEVENGLRQFDRGIDMIHFYVDQKLPFALRPNMLLDLQQIAVEGIESNPGEFRTTEVRIEKSLHQPPAAHLVPNLVLEMCEYVNDNLHEKTPFHLAAYLMWRHNWIHPFTDGNGRTSRTISYIVLSMLLGYELPGTPTIPDQIASDRTRYFRALEAADAAWIEDRLDVTAMEEMLKAMLGRQLLSVIEAASGEALS